MNPFELIKIPYFLLDEKWKETGIPHGRISFALLSFNGFAEHVEHYEKQRDRLLSENDDNYTSWVFTSAKYENMGGSVPHVTVFHFRVRDSH